MNRTKSTSVRESRSRLRVYRCGQNGHYFTDSLFAVLIFFVFSLFPLINLFGMAVATGTVALGDYGNGIAKAALQHTHALALNAMVLEASALSHNGFAALLKLHPIGGYQYCGADLFIDATSFKGGGTTSYGPNTPIPLTVPPLVDPATHVYEYSVHAAFSVGPFIDMSNIPWIASVPGIGAPALINWCASRSVECVKGIQGAIGLSNDLVPSLALGPSATQYEYPAVQNGVVGWRNPGIFEEIIAAGQTIVAQDVLIVYANNPDWTPSDIQVTPGETIWLDTRSEGAWNLQSVSSSQLGMQTVLWRTWRTALLQIFRSSLL